MSEYVFDFGIVKAGAPVITISSLGIAFNGVVRRMIGEPDAVKIGYDRNHKAIAICACNSDESNSYFIKGRVRQDWVRIGCKDFVRYLAAETGMDFSAKARQFISTYDDVRKMVIAVISDDTSKHKS